MMTHEEMKRIINTEVPFNELKKNDGILIFYEEGIITIGISYEDYEGYDCYIYNLFIEDDEYINISGSANVEERINESILNERLINGINISNQSILSCGN